MVDIFALALSHGLLALAAWRLLLRPDLDVEGAQPERTATTQERKEQIQGGERRIARGVTWRHGAEDDA